MDEYLEKYRAHLVDAEKKSQEDYDKTVVSLSGGALGVSFIFLKDIIGAGPVQFKGLLLAAWLCWGVSVTAVLFSFFASNMALRHAISQVDEDNVYDQPVGGRFARITTFLNGLGGALFLAGVALMAIFVLYNLEVINVRQK